MTYQAKNNHLTFTNASWIASVTAESNALTVGTVANWLDVTAWRKKVKANQVESPNSPANYQTVKEFDLEIACDATETITSAKLYGIRQLPLTNADDTFTASGATLTATAHGLLTGDGPFRLTNSGGALPAGLSTGTDYWIIYLGANTFSVATSLANAIAGTAVTTTDAGTGTHTIADKQTADGFLNTDDHTKRLHWFEYGDINAASTVTVGAQLAYVERIQHSPLTLYYEVGGTSGTGAQTLTIRAIPVQSVEW